MFIAKWVICHSVTWYHNLLKTHSPPAMTMGFLDSSIKARGSSTMVILSNHSCSGKVGLLESTSIAISLPIRPLGFLSKISLAVLYPTKRTLPIVRPLKLGEHVHHLDENKSNNSPDNLLVLENPMHGKLHAWLNKHNIIPTPEYQKRTELGCIRCKICERPIRCGDVYCSSECVTIGNRKDKPVTKEELEKMVWEKSTVHIAKDLNVSDVAVGKLCNRLNVEKPPRGYWAKKKAEEDTVLFRIRL